MFENYCPREKIIRENTQRAGYFSIVIHEAYNKQQKNKEHWCKT